MPNIVANIYQKKQVEYNNLINKLKQQIRIISFFRLIFFVGIFVAFFYFYSSSLKLAIISSLICLTIFLYLIKLFLNKKYLFNFNSYLAQINGEEYKACNHNYTFFEDGNEFIDKEHDYSFDLDIFGKGSLFQYLNRSATLLGKKRLAVFLQNSDNSISEISKKQEIVSELSTKLDWRQKFIAYGKFLNSEKNKSINFSHWLNSSHFFSNNKLNKIIIYVLSCLTIVIISLAIFKIIPYAAIAVTIVYQLIFYTFFSKRINDYHNKISKYSSVLENYSRIFKHIENSDWISEVIRKQVDLLGNNKASNATAKLSSLVGMLDTRLSILLGFILNWIVLWDLQCIHRIEDWKVKYEKDINNWFNSLGTIDAFQSLANFKFNHPNYIVPELVDKAFVFKTENMGHPLLIENERINNDFSCVDKANFTIITGANMAGKSTFLRTVGVNLILAMAGAPVCASKLQFTPVKVFSSMRTDDSLQRNKSYFFAELQRLKIIINKINSGENLFLILDEILKGTNSKDKEIGSKAFLKKLIKLKANGIIATHDLSLGELEKEFPGNIKNMCFEVQIVNNELIFDYKLYFGITKNLNASFLLNKMGII
ncbi:MAG: hypothetical protein GXO79_08000 [Chlorobi bacterium]|nr:hypothetical protein [Chlorobiota bacterium]